MADKSKLQQLIDDKIAAGLPADDAREVAQRQIDHDDQLAADEAAAAKAAKKKPAADEAAAAKAAKKKPAASAADAS